MRSGGEARAPAHPDGDEHSDDPWQGLVPFDELHNEIAARYGASVATTTDEPAEAYADWRQEPWAPMPNPWPLDRSA